MAPNRNDVEIRLDRNGKSASKQREGTVATSNLMITLPWIIQDDSPEGVSSRLLQHVLGMETSIVQI